jgi:hypothetical protein
MTKKENKKRTPRVSKAVTFEQRRDEWAQAYAKDACRLLKLPIHPKNYLPIACIIKAADDHRPRMKPLPCIDQDGPCTPAHAAKTGKDCSGCGG